MSDRKAMQLEIEGCVYERTVFGWRIVKSPPGPAPALWVCLEGALDRIITLQQNAPTATEREALLDAVNAGFARLRTGAVDCSASPTEENTNG